MQNEKITTESVLLGIPRGLMIAAGLKEGMLLQMTAEAGKLVIERVENEDTSDYVCDGDCDNCPINATDCDGTVKTVPAKTIASKARCKQMKIYRIIGKRGRITIPYALRQKLEIGPNDVLSFSETTDKRAIVVRKEQICDCEKTEVAGTDEMTLYDFLNGLSAAQQRAALVHLSVKWAEAEGHKT